MTNLSPAANILQELIRCPSVTPLEGGALDYLENRLKNLGFVTHRVIFSDENTPDVENLYARFGTAQPNLCFAGHTDVVPTGDDDAWSEAPFAGTVRDGQLYGRGAVDMKGGIACFIAAVEDFLGQNKDFPGSISFLITGDEEGPAINGTDKLLKWVDQRGEKIDACLLGEPTNPNMIGDAIKIGRRGSLSGKITVNGTQGHVAYPHLADNPVPQLVKLIHTLLSQPLDTGTKAFQPSNLEITSIDVGNPSVNVIPAKADAHFNIRFNDNWSDKSLQEEIIRRLDGAANAVSDHDKNKAVQYSVEWRDRPAHVFLTKDTTLIDAVRSACENVTGQRPDISTAGGTSDARFIKDYAPVVEFGLVGQTMHQVDERVDLADLEILTAIYHKFIEKYFNSRSI